MIPDKLQRLTEELRSGGVEFMVDTNILRTSTKLFNLAERIVKLNEIQSNSESSKLIVSQVVCAERLFQLKRQHRDRYDRDEFLQQFPAKGIEQEAFDASHAHHFAEIMYSKFETDDRWHEFKLDWYIKKLGITDRNLVKAKGKHCSATIDWLILAQADMRNRWLITKDTGLEFELTERKVLLAEVDSTLDALMAP